MPGTAAATLTIRIDTRERDPFDFASVSTPVIPFTAIRATLKTGDYDVAEFAERPPADRITVERKSLQDLYKIGGHPRYPLHDHRAILERAEENPRQHYGDHAAAGQC